MCPVPGAEVRVLGPVEVLADGSAIPLPAKPTRLLVALVVASYGLWYGLSRRRWRPAAVIVVAGVAVAVLAIAVVVPHFAPGGGSPGVNPAQSPVRMRSTSCFTVGVKLFE